MPSVFDNVFMRAEQTITHTMMNEWLIQNQPYQAVLDEDPNLMSEADYRINGTVRTLTLFKSTGYKPKLGHKVNRGKESYLVRGFSFVDNTIVLQLE